MLFPFIVEMQPSQNKSTLLSELLQTVCVCVYVLLLPPCVLTVPGIVHYTDHEGMREHGDYNYNDTGTSGAA